MEFNLICNTIIKMHNIVQENEGLSIPIHINDWHSLTPQELIYIHGLMDRYGMEFEFEGDYVFITLNKF